MDNDIEIIYSNENIFDYRFDAIVNPVNCVGIMGKGLALEFKNRYNGLFEEYYEAYKHNEIKIGKIFRYIDKDNNIIIYNFPTKQHWRDKSSIDYIKKGMDSLLEMIDNDRIKSIGIPALGCGLEGLIWKAVSKIIESKFLHYKFDNNIRVVLFKRD